MLKVEIKPNQAKYENKSGVSKAGKSYSINEQQGYLYNGGDYPLLFKFSLADGASAYPAGFYEIHESSFYIGDFQSLKVGKLLLIPLNQK